MATLTIDGDLRHEFNHRWRSFTKRKLAAVRTTTGLEIIVDPVQQGPDQHGRFTYRDVPSEFLDELRADKFGSVEE